MRLQISLVLFYDQFLEYFQGQIWEISNEGRFFYFNVRNIVFLWTKSKKLVNTVLSMQSGT